MTSETVDHLERDMGGFTVDLEALEQCRTEVSGQVGPMTAAADDLPSGVSAASFGDLDAAGELADAVNAFSDAVATEIGAAGERLAQVGVAVEAVIDGVRDTEQNNARCLVPARRMP
ncbi:hypothetical protein [Actinophytocola sp. NPDC049390]|uniref:hypothetical protein n=1 Tax=Actinophytocola sp. NPDC049390 TaxID=3363894 RepID=UPI0037BC76D2